MSPSRFASLSGAPENATKIAPGRALLQSLRLAGSPAVKMAPRAALAAALLVGLLAPVALFGQPRTEARPKTETEAAAGTARGDAASRGDDAPAEAGGDETSYFFGEGDSFEERSGEELYKDAHRFSDEERSESSVIEEENGGREGRWVDEDISPLFPELSIIDEVSAENSLQRLEAARRSYREALGVLRRGDARAENEREDLEAQLQADEPQYAWKEHDRREGVERRMRQIRTRARMDAVSYLVRAIQTLDSVKNPQVRDSEQYVDLKSDIYRQYVKSQFQLRNFTHCIDVLETYLRLRPEHKDEPEAHRLLAACYRYQEVVARRMQDRRSQDRFKSKKNAHLLAFARLAYGEGSPEFSAIQRRVERDMLVQAADSSDR